MRKFCFLLLCLFSFNAFAQSHLSVNAGYNQSIFYCSQTKAEYPHSYSSYNAYLVNINYKEDLFKLCRNLRLGAQLEMKQQSAWFYFEDVYEQKTVATGVRFDIRSLNLHLFPELVVGDKVKFVFSGGPFLQYVFNVKEKGRQVEIVAGQENIERNIEDKNSSKISGFCFGAKLCLGLEIPLYKGLYLTFNNAYTGGFSGFKGDLSKRMKFFNSLDINLTGGLLYRFEHQDWFPNKTIKTKKEKKKTKKKLSLL